MPWFSRKAKVVDEATEPVKKDEDSRLKDSSSSKDSSNTKADDYDDEGNDKAQDVVAEAMGDNLDVMRDIVFRIREDEEFAKSIYANCPRLQKHLDEHPDLRPIFEDPKLVRINFEKVYRDQGGVLPEDEPEKPPGVIKRAYERFIGYVAIVTSHPLFKVFKIFMLIKKIIGFLSPTKGFGIVQGFFLGLLEDPDADILDGDADGDVDDGGNPAHLEMKMQLNAAAEHMEDPEVQERMEEMLDSPDTMDETIENDPQLRALRDENPLCRELMSNPDTMKILVDPDNLRALGEAPDLIELDFADPGGYVPDEFPDLDVDSPEVEVDVDPEAEVEPDEPDEPEAEPEEEEQESNMYDDIKDGVEVEDSDKTNSARARGLKQSKQSQQREGDKDEAKGWLKAAVGVVGGQALASLGLSDMIFGGDDDLGVSGPEAVEAPPEIPTETGLEGEFPVEDSTDLAAEDPTVEEGGITVQALESDVEVGGAKSKAKGANSGGDNGGGGGVMGAIKGAAVGLVAGSVLGSVLSADHVSMVSDLNENYQDRKAEMEEEDEDGKRGEETKKGRFAFLGAVHDLAKDTIISSVLGDVVGEDLADNILDTQEEIEEIKEEDEEEDDDNDDGGARRPGQAKNGAGNSDNRQPNDGFVEGFKDAK